MDLNSAGLELRPEGLRGARDYFSRTVSHVETMAAGLASYVSVSYTGNLPVPENKKVERNPVGAASLPRTW